MSAGAVWKVAGLGDDGVHFPRAFAFPFAFLSFQNREPFLKGAWTLSTPLGPWGCRRQACALRVSRPGGRVAG